MYKGSEHYSQHCDPFPLVKLSGPWVPSSRSPFWSPLDVLGRAAILSECAVWNVTVLMEGGLLIKETVYCCCILNLSCHGPFFPCHLTASGHIKPGSSGHMRPGRETPYPSSPIPHRSCRRVLDTFSIDMISFNIVYFAC